MYRQDWENNLRTKEHYSVYSTFKSSLSLSAYLNELKHVKARHFLIRLRLGVSPLRTHNLRYRKDVTHVDYFCLFCVGDAETEVHFILVCPKYAEIREQYIPRRYFNCPSSFELAVLLAATNKFLLIRLDTYHESFHNSKCVNISHTLSTKICIKVYVCMHVYSLYVRL